MTAAQTLIEIDVTRIDPSPYQSRLIDLNSPKLQELAGSIREKGVIQPATVRISPQDPARYELVCGERRWRASILAGRRSMRNAPRVTPTLYPRWSSMAVK